MIYKHRVLLAHSIPVLPPTTFCQLSWGTKPKKSLCAYGCGQRNGLGRVFSHPDLRDQPSVSRSNEKSSPEPQSEPPDSEASVGLLSRPGPFLCGRAWGIATSSRLFVSVRSLLPLFASICFLQKCLFFKLELSLLNFQLLHVFYTCV